MPGAPVYATERMGQVNKEILTLEKQLVSLPDAAELDAAKARHADAMATLHPKPKPAPAAPQNDAGDIRMSVPRVMATLSGNKLGISFRCPEDMPELRKAAARW